MALLEVLTDQFTGQPDSTKWTISDTGTALCKQYDNQIIVEVPSNASSSSYGLVSSVITNYDLTASYGLIEVVQMCNLATHAQVYFRLKRDASNYLQFVQENGVLYAQKIVATATTTLRSQTFDRINHKWLRIREAGGTIFWDVSANGTTWTSFTSNTNPFVITSMQAEFGAGTYQPESTPGDVIFDNFNVSSPIQDATRPAHISALKDNFNDRSLGSQWTRSGSSVKIPEIAGKLILFMGAGTSTYVRTTNQYSIKDGAIYFRVSCIGPLKDITTNGTGQGLTMQFQLRFTDTLNSYYIGFEVYWNLTLGMQIEAWDWNGSGNTHGVLEFSSALVKWLRIREEDGTFYYDWSSNGKAWENMGSVDNTWWTNNIWIRILAESSNKTDVKLMIDNLNTSRGSSRLL